LNGKVERSHQTDQEEFSQVLPFTVDVDLNKKLETWENSYNFKRLHGAFNGKTNNKSMKIKIIYPILSLTFLLTSCHVGRYFIWNFADINDQYRFDKQKISNGDTVFHFYESRKPNDNLKVPKQFNINGDLARFEEVLSANKTIAFIVIRKDTIIYEKYFDDYNVNTPHPSFSVAKSFVSVLIGIAIDEGKIISVNEPITNYLSGFKHPEFNNITIKHLLNMRSGIRFNEGYGNPFGDVARFYYGRNLDRYLSKLKIKEKPDKQFDYISVNTQLLAAILEKATGKPIYLYLEEKIWKPLGMGYNASWSIDSEKHNTTKAFCCLNGTARDFAKFGRLYLSEGMWNEKRIISKNWIQRSIEPNMLNDFMYSNHWWHMNSYFVLPEFSDSSKKIEIQGPHIIKNTIIRLNSQVGKISSVLPINRAFVSHFSKRPPPVSVANRANWIVPSGDPLAY